MTESEKLTKIPLKYINGFPFPEPFIQEKDVVEALNYRPVEGDIFVTTYPKCGTTWLMYIIWEVVNKGAPPPPPYILMLSDIPFLEFTGTGPLAKLNTRIMKTHLPFDRNPYSPEAKYFYVYRNPWDCCVSYFYHERDMEPNYESLTFDVFFECFLKGEVPWGDFFDHFLSWYEHRNDPNVFYVKYEDMKKDPRAAVLKVAKFLGEEYSSMLEDEEDLLEKILLHTNFKYLKETAPCFTPLSPEGFENLTPIELAKKLSSTETQNVKKVEFFRKGKVGDWKNHFSEEQKVRFREYIKRKLTGTPVEGTLMEEWMNME